MGLTSILIVSFVEVEPRVEGSHSKLVFYVLLTLTTIFWGGAFPAAKIVATHIPPATTAAIRFSIAMPLFFLLTKLWGQSIVISTRLHLYAAIFGLLQVTAYNFFFFEGIKYTTSSNSVLIIASGPAITAFMASIAYTEEKLNAIRGLGVMLAFSGVLLIVLLSTQGQIQGNLRGDLITFVAALAFAIYTTYSKICLRYLSPIQLTSWGTFYGVIALWLLAITEDKNNLSVNSTVVWSMLYLAILAGVFGFLFYNIGAKEIGPSNVAIFINLVPVFGVLTSVIILGEELTVWHPIAFLLVLSGVYLVNQNAHRSP